MRTGRRPATRVGVDRCDPDSGRRPAPAAGCAAHAPAKESPAGGAPSSARQAWVDAQLGRREVIEVFDTKNSLNDTATAIQRFIAAWLPVPPHSVPLKQNEHALESRILRGKVPLVVGGRRLQLLRRHDTVNWGSQFPTKWGRGGSARYLDALLRDGTTPWAVEMRVQGGGGGGQYYRHAIAQAVLYREFIRRAEPLNFWFKEKHKLDPKACRAAVVVPELNGGHAKRAPRLRRLGELFEVELVEVPHTAAQLR